MSYEDKAAKLQEALSMIKSSEGLIPEHNILYEDDMVIIYKQ